MWTEYSRARVRAYLEEQTGKPLHVSDTLPDSLIAESQAADVPPCILEIWIAAGAGCREDWSVPVYREFLETETVRGAVAAIREARS